MASDSVVGQDTTGSLERIEEMTDRDQRADEVPSNLWQVAVRHRVGTASGGNTSAIQQHS
jgi:hypothetical protein